MRGSAQDYKTSFWADENCPHPRWQHTTLGTLQSLNCRTENSREKYLFILCNYPFLILPTSSEWFKYRLEKRFLYQLRHEHVENSATFIAGVV